MTDNAIAAVTAHCQYNLICDIRVDSTQLDSLLLNFDEYIYAEYFGTHTHTHAHTQKVTPKIDSRSRFSGSLVHCLSALSRSIDHHFQSMRAR